MRPLDITMSHRVVETISFPGHVISGVTSWNERSRQYLLASVKEALPQAARRAKPGTEVAVAQLIIHRAYSMYRKTAKRLGAIAPRLGATASLILHCPIEGAPQARALRPRSREANRSHAFDSPVPGECKGEPHAANATTGRGGRTDSEAGLRSDADEQPDQSKNSRKDSPSIGEACPCPPACAPCIHLTSERRVSG
jgi:hypothetical protein